MPSASPTDQRTQLAEKLLKHIPGTGGFSVLQRIRPVL